MASSLLRLCCAPLCVQDPASQLSWFNYLVCDPAASEPGRFEQEGRDGRYLWQLNRNTHLTWDALRPAVAAALATTPAQWRDELWPANANTFYLLPGGQVARGNASLPRSGCPTPVGAAPLAALEPVREVIYGRHVSWQLPAAPAQGVVLLLNGCARFDEEWFWPRIRGAVRRS